MSETDEPGMVSRELAGLTLSQARELADYVQQQALVNEAEDTAHGARYLTVVTGDLETDEDAARVRELTDTAWAGGDQAHVTSVRGTNDTHTFRVVGAGADRFVDEMVALAQRLDPGWWRVRRAAQ